MGMIKSITFEYDKGKYLFRVRNIKVWFDKLVQIKSRSERFRSIGVRQDILIFYLKGRKIAIYEQDDYIYKLFFEPGAVITKKVFKGQRSGKAYKDGKLIFQVKGQEDIKEPSEETPIPAVSRVPDPRPIPKDPRDPEIKETSGACLRVRNTETHIDDCEEKCEYNYWNVCTNDLNPQPKQPSSSQTMEGKTK